MGGCAVATVSGQPTAAGAEAGLLVRLTGADAGYRLLRIVTRAGGQALDMVLERLNTSMVAELARRDDIPVAPR